MTTNLDGDSQLIDLSVRARIARGENVDSQNNPSIGTPAIGTPSTETYDPGSESKYDQQI